MICLSLRLLQCACNAPHGVAVWATVWSVRLPDWCLVERRSEEIAPGGGAPQVGWPAPGHSAAGHHASPAGQAAKD